MRRTAGTGAKPLKLLRPSFTGSQAAEDRRGAKLSLGLAPASVRIGKGPYKQVLVKPVSAVAQAQCPTVYEASGQRSSPERRKGSPERTRRTRSLERGDSPVAAVDITGGSSRTKFSSTPPSPVKLSVREALSSEHDESSSEALDSADGSHHSLFFRSSHAELSSVRSDAAAVTLALGTPLDDAPVRRSTSSSARAKRRLDPDDGRLVGARRRSRRSDENMHRASCLRSPATAEGSLFFAPHPEEPPVKIPGVMFPLQSRDLAEGCDAPPPLPVSACEAFGSRHLQLSSGLSLSADTTLSSNSPASYPAYPSQSSGCFPSTAASQTTTGDYSASTYSLGASNASRGGRSSVMSVESLSARFQPHGRRSSVSLASQQFHGMLRATQNKASQNRWSGTSSEVSFASTCSSQRGTQVSQRSSRVQLREVAPGRATFACDTNRCAFDSGDTLLPPPPDGRSQSTGTQGFAHMLPPPPQAERSGSVVHVPSKRSGTLAYPEVAARSPERRVSSDPQCPPLLAHHDEEDSSEDPFLAWKPGQSTSLEMLGLGDIVTSRLIARSAPKLHDWQFECLQTGGGAVMKGESLVYSAPTGGGKTLVAEVLVARRLLIEQTGGTVLWVVPLKALANEVAEKLACLFEGLAEIRAFHGDDGGAKLRPEVRVAVCTVERANMIVNAQLAQRAPGASGDEDSPYDYSRGCGIDGVSMVIVDEVHNVETNLVLERLLAKVVFANLQSAVHAAVQDDVADDGYRCGSGGPAPIQIVACSATIPNATTLAAWLGAWVYETSRRPTELNWVAIQGRDQQGYCEVVPMADPCSSGVRIGAAASVLTHGLTQPPRLKAKDGDSNGLVAVCAWTLQQAGGSVLVFCNSRSDTARLAAHLQKNLPAMRSRAQPAVLDARLRLAAEMEQVSGPLAAKGLPAAIRGGVGFHHAGLTQWEKGAVEQAFRAGTLDVLCATTTLANGVNTPAATVVIYNAVKFDAKPYSPQALKQMGGRAARLGGGGVDGRPGTVAILLSTGHGLALPPVAGAKNSIGARNSIVGSCAPPPCAPPCAPPSKHNGSSSKWTLFDVVGFSQPPVRSPLVVARGGAEAVDASLMELTVLEAVTLGVAADRPSLLAYAHCLFARHTLTPPPPADSGEAEGGGAVCAGCDDGGACPALEAAVDEVLAGLTGGAQPLLSWVGQSLVPAALGRAAAAALLTPAEARGLEKDLHLALRRLVVTSPLHLLCLVVPADDAFLRTTPWAEIADLFVDSDAGCASEWGRVADTFVGPHWRARVLSRKAGVAGGEAAQDERLGRLWRALVLLHVIDEDSRWLASYSRLEAGTLQALQRQAFEASGKVGAFAKALGLGALAAVVKPLRARLEHGVKKELLPLRSALSATPSLLRALYDAGFSHPKHLARPGADRALLALLAKRRASHYSTAAGSGGSGAGAIGSGAGTAVGPRGETARNLAAGAAASASASLAASLACAERLDRELVARLIAEAQRALARAKAQRG